VDYAEMVKIIAPCGLNCGQCLVYEGGQIRRLSQDLADALGPNFAAYAQRFTGLDPVFENYPAFEKLLSFLAQGTCRTCRQGECLFAPCQVRTCVQERGVDFCFQCPDFPCDRTGLPPAILDRWRRNNELMAEHGVEGFYDRVKDKPRYP